MYARNGIELTTVAGTHRRRFNPVDVSHFEATWLNGWIRNGTVSSTPGWDLVLATVSAAPQRFGRLLWTSQTGQQLIHHRLGISKQHSSVVLEEEWILNSRITGAHAAFHHHYHF